MAINYLQPGHADGARQCAPRIISVSGGFSGETLGLFHRFLDRADLAARYAEVSGRDTSQLDFYVTFAFWKLVCILEGVYARYLGGALGQRDPAELEPFNQQVLGAAARAEEMLGRLS